MQINNKLMKKTFLSLKIADNITTVSEYREINNFEVDKEINKDKKIEIQSGKIKINKDVKLIKISGALGFNCPNNQLYLWAKKNGVSVGVWQVTQLHSAYTSVAIEQVLSVTKDDIISLALHTSANSILEKTKTIVNVEVIE